MDYGRRIFMCLAFFVFSENVSTNKLPLKNWLPRSSTDVRKSHSNCSELKLLNDDLQPTYSEQTSFIRKCCPHGQSYELEFESGKEKKTRRCAENNYNFSVSVINALFYENCIEDDESAPQLGHSYVNACSSYGEDSLLYSNYIELLYAKSYGDLLYVLQNGSLLTVQFSDEHFEAYEVHNDYCLDMDRVDGFLYAIVCIRTAQARVRVLRGEAVIYAVCLWLSVPCLLFTAFFYLKIGELRELHGKSLACHCTCLAAAYALLGIVQIQSSIKVILTYFIQYFLLACICWLSALCCDICIKISYIYVKKVSCSINTEKIYFPAYAIASFGLPLLPVLFAVSQHKFGIPLYYIKGQHSNNILTGDHFVFLLPSALLLFICCGCLFVIFYAFRTRQPKIPNAHWAPEAVTEYEEFFKLKKTAKSVAFLLVVLSICRIIEIITSQLNAAEIENDADTISPFAFFDILIALQGVFIFVIFCCSPTPLWIIKRWWISSGSFECTASNTELSALKKENA